MPPPWESIEERFVRLRDFVLGDLEGYVAHETGGNFAVVAVAMAACDALGRLLYGGDSGDKVFARCLPGAWRPAAPILYDALRHGLIHGYDAQYVEDTNGDRLGFAIAWRGESVHLHFADTNRDLLYVSAPALVGSLRTMFEEVENELRVDGDLRDRFFMRDRRGRVIYLREQSEARADAWRQAVLDAPLVPGPSGARGPRRSWSGEEGQGATGPGPLQH
jgi:hypothetical protein